MSINIKYILGIDLDNTKPFFTIRWVYFQRDIILKIGKHVFKINTD